jgi:hypothetical protein
MKALAYSKKPPKHGRSAVLKLSTLAQLTTQDFLKID